MILIKIAFKMRTTLCCKSEENTIVVPIPIIIESPCHGCNSRPRTAGHNIKNTMPYNEARPLSAPIKNNFIINSTELEESLSAYLL